MRIKFLFCCSVYAAIFGAGKIGVDSCLPDRGSQILSLESRLPPAFCDRLRTKDEASRISFADLNAQLGGLSPSDGLASKHLFNAAMSVFLMPTVVLAEFPRSSTVSVALMVCILVVSGITALFWAMLDSVLGGSTRASRLSHSRRTRADTSSAVLRIKRNFSKGKDDFET